MARVAVSNQVIYRSNKGQFLANINGGATRTVQRTIDRGVELSKGYAPIGRKPDERTVPLHAGFFTKMLSSTAGVWGNFARHALPIELGAGPHQIPGNPALRFYWEAMGRMWIPAEIFYQQPGLPDLVNHPGNAAQPFLRPAYEDIRHEVMAIARQEF